MTGSALVLDESVDPVGAAALAAEGTARREPPDAVLSV